MKALHEDLQIKDFEMPDGVEVLEYCTASGQLATPNCTNRETGVYKSSFKPDMCQKHSSMNTTTTTAPVDGTTSAEDASTSGDNAGESTTTTTVADLPPSTDDPDAPQEANQPAA